MRDVRCVVLLHTCPRLFFLSLGNQEELACFGQVHVLFLARRSEVSIETRLKSFLNQITSHCAYPSDIDDGCVEMRRPSELDMVDGAWGSSGVLMEQLQRCMHIHSSPVA